MDVIAWRNMELLFQDSFHAGVIQPVTRPKTFRSDLDSSFNTSLGIRYRDRNVPFGRLTNWLRKSGGLISRHNAADPW